MVWADMPKTTKSKVQSPKPKAKAKPTPVKKVKATSSTDTEAPIRKIKQPDYKSFRLSKRIRHPKPLIGSFRLFKLSVLHVTRHWRLFGGIMLIYLILNIILVKGLGVNSDISTLQTTLQDAFEGGGQLYTSFTLFSVILGSSNAAPSELAGAYQSMLLVLVSLAIIWALRQTQAKVTKAPSVRDALYSGMYPLVPFLTVLFVTGLQLLPLLAGSFLYVTVIGGGIVNNPAEQVLWYALIGALATLSLYMLTSSLFALYIVTLPNFKPLAALRTARLRVLHRRLQVVSRMLFLPIALLVLLAVIVVPVIMLSPVVAEWLFYVLSILALVITHSYLYNLYRELIRE